MIIEKILFTLIAIALFTIFFMKFIKKSDTSYVVILALEFIGITINFIEIFIGKKLYIYIRIIMYILAIAIPLLIIFLEKFKQMNFPEVFNLIRCEILLKQNKIDKAKKIMINFINKNNNSYVAHKFMAKCYEKEENCEAAISEYITAIELNKNDYTSICSLATLYCKNKQNEQAIDLLQEVLRQKPENRQATDLLGNIFFEKEMYKEAYSVYTIALRYYPGDYDLYYNLGMVCTMLNDFSKAKELYKKAAQINSLSYHSKLSLGQIELLYGELENAEKYFMQCIDNKETEMRFILLFIENCNIKRR